MNASSIHRLSIGKRRGLQSCSTSHGTFSVLALDHRNNLRRALNPQSPDAVTAEDMITFKQEVVSALSTTASAVLLDPEFGAAQGIASDVLAGSTGLIVALDATGYLGESDTRHSQILPDWTVEKARRMGAAAVKLLVYYHPNASTANEVESLVKQVADECTIHDIAFFLEPLSYSADPARPKLSSEERYEIVLETARRLTPLGIDVLKVEFPLDINPNSDEDKMANACGRLSECSVVPWVLLSASVNFDTYLHQVSIACQAGASGIAAGRAVWQEACSLTLGARSRFLEGTARERMERLTALCYALGCPWCEFFDTPTPTEHWYAQY